ncbi:hypothetical protein ACR9WD_14430 [Glutamicibacter sp. PAEs-4]|uniref:hypothetical protein n=1 Tax=Glutamicibacter sp. PAEs-4 TaxID=3444114 RepID=UPI003EB717AF
MEFNRTEVRIGSSLTLIQRIVLNACAVAGTLCLVMAVLALAFGIKPLVFASGSMGPGIPTGSLGIAVPMAAQDAAIGDVVSVVNGQGQRITHRVIEQAPGGLVLKGDANSVPDVEAYPVDQVDRLIFSAPLLGYAVTWLSQPWVYFLGGLLCAYVLFIAFRRDGRRHGKAGPPRADGPETASAPPGQAPGETPTAKRASNSSRVIAVLAVAALLGTIALQGPKAEVTQAAFTGSATASSAIRANTVPPATGTLACTESGLVLTTATVSWPAQTLPPGARLVLRLQTGASTFAYTNLASGATSAAYGPGLNLLGLITSGGSRAMELKLLVVYTTDNNAVTETGSNIGWSAPVATSPTRTIVYHPGLLLARDFACA